MSVYQLFFVFGKPGSYMLDHPKRCTQRNMPEQLTRFQRDHRGQEVQSLALDANENYFFRCTDSSGQSWTDVPDIQQYYPELFEWFEINEARQSRATFGSNVGEFFVWADNGAWQYQNLNLPQWLQKDKRRVKQVALGINGAWFILFTNGQWSMACDTTYPDLYKILNAHERGDVVFVAMNPHRKNEFFIALANNTVHIKASAVCEVDVNDVLSAYDELEIVTSQVSNFSHNVAEAAKIPRRYRKRDFLLGIANSTAGGIATGLVSAAITASCSVM